MITAASASTLGESKDVGLADAEGRLYYAILLKELEHMHILVSIWAWIQSPAHIEGRLFDRLSLETLVGN